ncbi:MAG: type II secretion system protein [Candidatus Omnitrophota bacterium]|nr:type II secretion system protein [Candidatus Omnitrophota bacterium]
MSRKNNRSDLRGFSLPELLVGALIFSMIAAIAVTAYVMLSRMLKEDIVLRDLSRGANIAIEKMIRGRPANTGLAAAKSVELPLTGASGDSVNYTDMTGVSRRFYYSAGSIRAESGSTIATDVGSVTFYNFDNTVRIDLVMRKYVVSREVRFSIQTQVSLRN